MINTKGFKVQDFFILISDSGNAVASKLITYVGVGVGIGGGAVQAVVTSSSNEFLQNCAEGTPDWLAYVSASAAVSLAVKNMADMYYKRLEFKKNNDNPEA